MKKTARNFYQMLLVCLLSGMSLCFSSQAADTEVEQDVKIGFIYNFTKFVTWPNSSDNNTSHFIVCASASPAFLEKLSLLNSKTLQFRPIEVIPLKDNKIQICNLIFFSATEAKPIKKNLLDNIVSLPILTISDAPNFTQEGGMIGMKNLDNRLRFDINLSAAKKAGLIISSQLSDLANEVIQ